GVAAGGRGATVHFGGVVVLFDFFFFSSRRRHTRFSRDWSSDVCSSDLHIGVVFARRQLEHQGRAQAEGVVHQRRAALVAAFGQRSEERRVGKECRARGAREAHRKKSRHGRAEWTQVPHV